MTPESIRILLVEDNPDDQLLIGRELRKGGVAAEMRRVETLEGVRAAVAESDWDLVISDYNLEGFSGLDALEIVKDRRPDLPFILASGTVGEEVAVQSIKAGADDYLLKQNLLRLVTAVRRALRESRERHQRAAAEAALSESRERLELIYNSVSDFLIFLTRGPEGDWVYADANRAFQRKLAELGLPDDLSGLLGREAAVVERGLFGSDSASADWLAACRRDATAQRLPVRGERTFRLTGGAFTAEFQFVPLPDASGEVRRLLIDGRDVTEMRRAEAQERRVREQLVQAQKMESLGTLSGGIAHDFNNLLTAILGFAEMAQHAPDLDTARTHAGQILQVAGRAGDLVRQILMFSRRQPTSREPFLIAVVVGELAALARASFAKTITFVTEVPDPGPRVWGNPSQFHQVLMNLCTNAAHAMPHGGRLTVCVEEIDLSTEAAAALPPLKAGRHARVVVSDTGLGISGDVIDRIFEPFFTTKPPGHGTGLGLSVVHGIVADHGGAMAVHSLVGAGTTFEIFLPVMPPS